MLAHIVLISHFLPVSFVFSLNVFWQYCLINCTFSFALMIQICDSSHMNISIFCFAFWQSTVFPGRPMWCSKLWVLSKSMNNYFFSWMRFGKNVLTPCRNFIKPHYGLANSWIQIVDFLKSWMHLRAPDATVFSIGKRNRALDYVWGLTD